MPEARVVRGKHSPNWIAQPWHRQVGGHGTLTVTYERVMTPVAESAMALLCGLWPLLLITTVGIALLWSATVYGTP